MAGEVLNETICLKQYISEKEYKEINELEKICSIQDKTNLKLELDYKLNKNKKSEVGLKNIDEFLYYVKGVLVAYLGISSFGGSNICEINGLTHPDYRRKGLFRKLFELAVQQCWGRGFSKILLLSDGNSGSGLGFIKSANGIYDFSEYRMKLIDQTIIDSIDCINLRKATNLDGKEIGRQNAIFFNGSEECEAFPEAEEELNEITYGRSK